MNPWILLIIAGLLEVVWASALKASNGFTILGPSLLTGIAAFVSFGLLGLAMKELPLGTAYGVWVGIGAIGAAIAGIVMFGDAATPLRFAGIALVTAGIIALKLA
ncbi:DMT family transporter [Sulfitobacter guttiformis]|uniref:Guanidinium exporter n=1 Tax=Sulfitobacter guttiformis TaxID=74349 RepID=A0A420DRB2_9RHOB|nr:multidrug efflux SMR transporter [Sulfitobacter guttiformis]KIN74071.1 Small multidrug resistance protein [Sulfitobacter guttiformis KCTC 32187]RKE96689.1 quaternary ammonium compound-resistance protein SugE [Sulfitobacter guttiformis]